MIRSGSITAFLATPLATPAQAHIGHLGEVAGHGHWIGLGLIAGAAVLAGVLGKGKQPDAGQDTDESPETEECPA